MGEENRNALNTSENVLNSLKIIITSSYVNDDVKSYMKCLPSIQRTD